MSEPATWFSNPVSRIVVGFVVIGVCILAVSGLLTLLGDPLDSVLGSSLSVLAAAGAGLLLAYLAFGLYFGWSEESSSH